MHNNEDTSDHYAHRDGSAHDDTGSIDGVLEAEALAKQKLAAAKSEAQRILDEAGKEAARIVSQAEERASLIGARLSKEPDKDLDARLKKLRGEHDLRLRSIKRLRLSKRDEGALAKRIADALLGA